MAHLFSFDLVPFVLRWHFMTALIAVQLGFLLKVRRRVLFAADVIVETRFPSTGTMRVVKNATKEEKGNDPEWNDDADDNLDSGWKTWR